MKTKHSKTWILIYILCISGINYLPAQLSFDSPYQIENIPITNLESKFVDLNNDGSQDLFIRGENQNGTFSSFIAVKTADLDTNNIDSFFIQAVNIDSTHIGNFLFSDINNDNYLDLLLSGTINNQATTTLYLGADSLTFESPVLVNNFNASLMDAEDLDNDGKKELVLSGKDQSGMNDFLIFEWIDNNLQLVSSGIYPGLTDGDLQIFDLNNDGLRDIIYSGLNAAAIPESIVLTNQNSFDFIAQNAGLPGLSHGKINLMNITGDTLADILIHGLDQTGQPFSDIFYNSNAGFIQANLGLTNISAGKQLLADVNADGFADIVLNGTDINQNSVSHLFQNNGSNNFLLNDSIFTAIENPNHTFGIIDCDGNLDLAQWTENGGTSTIQFFTNGSESNNGPTPPAQHYVFNTPEKVIIYWNQMTDDNHSSAAITSDLFIGASAADPSTLAPNFDMLELNRLLVSHGNQGYNRTVKVEDLVPQLYHYGIQSIDNSFNARGGGCGVSGGEDIARGIFIVCDTLSIDSLTACIGSSISLPGGSQTVWYSERDGFLENSGITQYPVTTNQDTLYYTTIGSLDCSEQGILIIIPTDGVQAIDVLNDTTVCKDELVNLSYNLPYDTLTWIIASSGEMSSENPFETRFSDDDEVYLSITQGGCNFLDTMLVSIQELEIIADPNTYKVSLGESIELNVTGADIYEWTPSLYLTSSTVSNPTCTPEDSITYTIIGTTIEGCADTTTIMVLVHTSAWAPTLFTPNNDGRNEAFKIYGEDFPENFTFKIFNRTGQVVYVHESNRIFTTGWNGTENGKALPSDVYYWKVNGSFSNGDPFLINGKKSGAVHLVR